MRAPAITQFLAAACLIAAACPASAQDCEVGLDCAGVALNGTYSGDWRRNTTGGVATGSAYSNKLILGANWRADNLFEEARLSGSASVMYLSGDAISGEFVGDLQGVNNIEADAGWYLNEAWTEFAFGGHSRTTLRAGVLDLNAEFDVTPTSLFFVAPPFGIGTDISQTGPTGPSIFPLTGLAIRAAGEWDSGLAWRFGVYDGAPGNASGRGFGSLHVSSDEGVLAIGELVYHSDRLNKLSLGAWGYSAKFEPIDAAVNPDALPLNGNRGFYALADLPLGTAGDTRFDGSLRVGTANERFNAVDHFAAASLVATGVWPGRPQDQLGLGVAWAHTGDPYRNAQAFAGATSTSAEIAWELSYGTSPTEWLALKPGVQYVQHPGADASLSDSWIVGLRFEVSTDQSWKLMARREPAGGSEVASIGKAPKTK
jgi:porin